LTRWRYAAATDTGLVRETNQDAYFVDDAVAIVADGMGGHAAGEVASAMSVDIIYDAFVATPTVDGMVAAIDSANRQVLADAAAHPERFGMGTTLVIAALIEDKGATHPVVFHVGDSRVYQLRDGALRQLTSDHSVAEEWVRMGRLTAEEALVHPRRHQLTRAIGVDQPLEIDVRSVTAQAGDRLLLCSDGLSNELTDEQIAILATSSASLEEAVQALVSAAKDHGGRDNITAVLVEFDAVSDGFAPLEATMTPLPPTPPEAPRPDPVPRAPKTRRRVTWRSAVVATVILGVVAAGVGILHWYAYANFYIGAKGQEVVIYQGQPGGVLLWKPTTVAVTPFPLHQFRSADQQLIHSTISEPSSQAAVEYVGYLHQQWQLSQPTTTTTTTTLPAPKGQR